MLILIPPLLAQITELVQSVPAAIASIPDSPWFVQLDPDDQAAVFSALEQFADWLSAPSTIATVSCGVLAAGVGFVSGLSATFIVVALTPYFLGSLNASKRALYALAPARNRLQLQDITERITDSVGRAVVGAVVLSSLNASAVLSDYEIVHQAISGQLSVRRMSSMPSTSRRAALSRSAARASVSSSGEYWVSVFESISRARCCASRLPGSVRRSIATASP